jgi:hypothetical protein
MGPGPEIAGAEGIRREAEEGDPGAEKGDPESTKPGPEIAGKASEESAHLLPPVLQVPRETEISGQRRGAGAFKKFSTFRPLRTGWSR